MVQASELFQSDPDTVSTLHSKLLKRKQEVLKEIVCWCWGGKKYTFSMSVNGETETHG